MPNKRDWRKGKGVKLIALFFLSKLREYEETELQNRFKAGEFTYDEVLINESSKPIYQENKISNYRPYTNKKSKKINDLKLFSCRNNSERNVNLIYLTLLKFKGLIRYMNFQDLVNDDIRQISCFITHKFFSKGQYLFRQYDSSDAMYGVISGKVDIRLVSAFDYTKKFLSALSKGEDEGENNYIIPVENFMSDLEEDDEVSDAGDSIELQEEDEDSEIEFGHQLKQHVIKNLIIQENMDDNIKDKGNQNIKEGDNNDKNKENQNNDDKNINDNNNNNNNINQNNQIIENNIQNNNQNSEKDNNRKLSIKRASINEEFIDNITDIEITIRKRKKIQTSIQRESKTLQKKKRTLLPNKKLSKSKNNSPKKSPIKKNSSKIIKSPNSKSKIKSPKRKNHIIKAIKKHQTPVNKNMTAEELSNFILEFELPRAQLSEGMCFGEWGILYCIPRTTSIYCLTDTDLFCLKKKYFDKYLAHKFIACDMKKIKFILARIPTLKRDYKMGKMLTKIVPIFCERGDIIYTPFEKANILYIVYKGECALYRMKNKFENKNEFLLNLEKLQMIYRLNPGGMAGLESCIEDGNYNYCLMVTKPMSILYKVELDFMLTLYKDFRDDLIPLYYEQKKVIDQLIHNYEETMKNCQLKNKIFREKEKIFNDELHKYILRPSSCRLNTFKFEVNVKDFNPKVSYNKKNQKNYSKFNSLKTIEHMPSFPKVKLPSFFAKRNKKNDDIIFITNKRTSIFNIRSCKTKIKNKFQKKIILNESNDNSNDENNKITKRTDTETDTLYTKKFQLFKKYNLSQKTGKTITITSNTYDRELTNTINSNYNNKSGIKYFKSGKYDLPLVG